MAGRSLIIGASGQLGRTLGLVLRGSRHEVIETVRRSPKPGQHLLDLADRAGILTTLEGLRPEWILIAGAFCNVDRCESERETCFRVNVEGPRAVAEYARETGAWVVYYS
ncbi:MAG: sugar nucleotide-binding protein, partial [Candidatus Omnitrophica bacterium]|nr:sugar nucleotide-binding protein [Candidatus Omnitrophota bacterium]